MPKQETIWASYTFTPEEAAQNAKELADKVAEKARLEERKKSLASEMKAKIDAVAATIGVLANKVSSGEESREYRCRVELDVPAKKRMYVDLNSGAIIKVEPFKVEDFQATLDFDDETPPDELTKKLAQYNEAEPEAVAYGTTSGPVEYEVTVEEEEQEEADPNQEKLDF